MIIYSAYFIFFQILCVIIVIKHLSLNCYQFKDKRNENIKYVMKFSENGNYLHCFNYSFNAL